MSIINSLYQDLQDEIHAINQYQLHIDSTENQDIKLALTSIKLEEMVHVGELLTLIDSLDEAFVNQILDGQDEVETLFECLNLANKKQKLTETKLEEKLNVKDLLLDLFDLGLSASTCDTIIGIFATTLKYEDVKNKIINYVKSGIIKEKLDHDEVIYLANLSEEF